MLKDCVHVEKSVVTVKEICVLWYHLVIFSRNPSVLYWKSANLIGSPIVFDLTITLRA